MTQLIIQLLLSNIVKDSMTTKIFGIGLPRTGTTSLHAALEILGYTSVHYPITWEEIDRYDAAMDISVACCFEELDQFYPGSKFILTVRDLNQWLQSCKYHFEQRINLDEFSPKFRKIIHTNRLKIFGTLVYDAVLFQEAYHRHLQHVQNYFAHRPEDLLIMNITGGDGWEHLCSFLKCSIPDQLFPNKNIANEPQLDVMSQSRNANS